jgi:hypothetical protein
VLQAASLGALKGVPRPLAIMARSFSANAVTANSGSQLRPIKTGICDREMRLNGPLRCINLERLMTEMGQKPRLPHCNIYNRFASLNGHNDGRASWSPAVADDV